MARAWRKGKAHWPSAKGCWLAPPPPRANVVPSVAQSASARPPADSSMAHTSAQNSRYSPSCCVGHLAGATTWPASVDNDDCDVDSGDEAAAAGAGAGERVNRGDVACRDGNEPRPPSGALARTAVGLFLSCAAVAWVVVGATSREAKSARSDRILRGDDARRWASTPPSRPRLRPARGPGLGREPAPEPPRARSFGRWVRPCTM
jgi:hypothetical protein